jgi:tetratricopeptide (TPR) repeat protein
MAWRFLHTPGLLGILVFIALLCGCNPKAIMLKSMDPIMDDMNIAVNRNTDVDMLHDAMPAFLVQMDGFLLSAPNDKRLLQTAEAYFGYANCYVEDTDKQRASMLYLKARGYALRALVGEAGFEKVLDKDLIEFKDLLQGYGTGDVPALFWTANSWIAWVALNLDKPEAIMDIPKAQAMLERVVELDETFYYGSAHAALGALYAAQPRIMGDTSAKAKQHFDKAFEISGRKLLFVHLYYAKFYAYQIQDRDLFIKTLEEVLAAPSDIFPDRAFANEVAKRKAKILLDNVDMYF